MWASVVIILLLLSSIDTTGNVQKNYTHYKEEKHTLLSMKLSNSRDNFTFTFGFTLMKALN